MTITGIETFVCGVDNVAERVRLFEDNVPEWQFEHITHQQVPVGAGTAVGHN